MTAHLPDVRSCKTYCSIVGRGAVMDPYLDCHGRAPFNGRREEYMIGTSALLMPSGIGLVGWMGPRPLRSGLRVL
jgi:hypothetical protein